MNPPDDAPTQAVRRQSHASDNAAIGAMRRFFNHPVVDASQ